MQEITRSWARVTEEQTLRNTRGKHKGLVESLSEFFFFSLQFSCSRRMDGLPRREKKLRA